jgi:hypothetical protein
MRSRAFAFIVGLVMLPFFSGASSASESEVVEREKRLQDVVDGLKGRLAISDRVAVEIVPVNKLVVSVERAKNRDDGFTLSIEDGFVQRLNNEEVGAVMAHELGHVWIYTHHPFLQTEELANEVAMRVVSREVLEGLYKKVWERVGTKGTLTYLPGR